MSRPEALAKTSGVTLRSHRQHVFEESLGILAVRPFLETKYRKLTGDDLRHWIRQSAWWHDIGKDDRIGWQQACRRDYDVYRGWLTKQGFDPNSVDGVTYAQYEHACRHAGRNPGANLLAFARRTGFRHEFESLRKMARCKDESFSLPVQVAVASHHSHLSYRLSDIKRWEQDCSGRFVDLWISLKREDYVRGYRSRTEWHDKIIERYRLAGPRSVLQLADTRASRAESGAVLAPIEQTNPFPYSFPYGKRRGVQREIERLFDIPIGMLRAPTGSGKTDGALLWIKHQVESGRADRGVIAMPTRFTSNALELNIRKNVSETGLYHSSAWFTRFGRVQGRDAEEARERHKMARLLLSPVTVTTVDHLLIALTATKEDHHGIFFNMAHAAVVLDEVDFYDPFVQANLTILIEVLRVLEVPVLLMSATLPESSRDLYQVPNPIIEAPEEPRTSTRRLAWAGEAEFAVGEPGRMSLPEKVESVLTKMIKRGTGIIYSNTVFRANQYRKWLEQRGVPANDIILYHSRFTEPDKKTIESRLLSKLGKSAWEAGMARGFAILTQIGEMSVNISAPIMLSELCPLDRLAQRAGRNGRFDVEGDATLHVVLPVRDGTVYPAPYGSYVAGHGWNASIPFERTATRLKEMLAGQVTIEIDAAAFVTEVNRLYPDAPEFSGGSEDNRIRLKDWMRKNWMIVPARQADEEDGTLEGEWRSRDIDPQETVVVQLPEAMNEYPGGEEERFFRFENWSEYVGFTLEFGVTIPVYLRDREVRRGAGSRLTRRHFLIADNPEPRSMWYADRYDDREGLAWLDEKHVEIEDVTTGII